MACFRAAGAWRDGIAGVLLFLALVAEAEAQRVSLVSEDPDFRAIHSIATDGSSLFVGGVDAWGYPRIWSLPARGGSATRLYGGWWSGPWAGWAIGLAAAGDDLYWIDPNSGPWTDTQVLRGPKTGGGRTAIYTGAWQGEAIVDGSGIATDGTRLYTVDMVQGRVHRLETSGAGLTELGRRYGGYFDLEHYQSLAVEGGTVYVAESGDRGFAPQLLAIPTSGGTFRTLHAGAPFVRLQGVAVAGDVVYVADAGAGNTIWEVPATGGTPVALVSGQPFSRIAGLAWANGVLYVADGAGKIYSIEFSRTSPEPKRPDSSCDNEFFSRTWGTPPTGTQNFGSRRTDAVTMIRNTDEGLYLEHRKECWVTLLGDHTKVLESKLSASASPTGGLAYESIEILGFTPFPWPKIQSADHPDTLLVESEWRLPAELRFLNVDVQMGLVSVTGEVGFGGEIFYRSKGRALAAREPSIELSHSLGSRWFVRGALGIRFLDDYPGRDVVQRTPGARQLDRVFPRPELAADFSVVVDEDETISTVALACSSFEGRIVSRSIPIRAELKFDGGLDLDDTDPRALGEMLRIPLLADLARLAHVYKWEATPEEIVLWQAPARDGLPR